MRCCLARGFLLLLFLLACLPLALSINGRNYAADESTYYLPSIARIAVHWPALDLVNDTTSATSPGYAYVLAGLSKLTGQRRFVFRLVTIAVSAAALAVLMGMFCPGDGGEWAAVLPLAASNFFIKSAAWVVTDNAALLLVCVSLLMLQDSPRGKPGGVAAGFCAAAAVFMRQLHGWLLLPLGCTAAFSLDGPEAERSSVRAVLAWLSLVPTLCVLLGLHHAWGGWAPPAWRSAVGAGVHPASVACALSVFAVFGVFYFAASARRAAGSKALGARAVSVGAAIGLWVALAAPTDPDTAHGRWGGYFWWAVGHLPVVWHRSLAIIAGAMLGGALLSIMAAELRRSAGRFKAALWTASIIGWLASCSLNQLAFQRYYEPPSLVFLIWWLSLVSASQGQADGPSVRPPPLVLLAGVQAVITAATTFVPVLASR